MSERTLRILVWIGCVIFCGAAWGAVTALMIWLVAS